MQGSGDEGALNYVCVLATGIMKMSREPKRPMVIWKMENYDLLLLGKGRN